MDVAKRAGGARLASVVGMCLAVFAAASAFAAVGYPEWMWVFVFAGLLLPPIVLTLALAAALVTRFSRG